MADSPHVFEAGQANFEADVLEASKTAPVLVDFWATWCGPCKNLGPVLEKLAGEFNGAFRLAKVDVDAEQALAGMFGVRSIPTVVLVKGGQLVDGFSGALPEAQVREFLSKHVEAPGVIGAEPEKDQANAPGAVQETPQKAIERLQREIEANPDKPELTFDLVQVCLRADRIADARARLDALPANLSTDARAARLREQIDLATSLQQALPTAELRTRLERDPDDHEARDLLGVRLLLEGEPEAGLEQLLQLLNKDRDWNDGQAKKRLIAAFGLISDEELVGRYRRKMASLLF